MPTTAMRSTQRARVDVDFKGELTGRDRELPVDFVFTVDPAVGAFEEAAADGDASGYVFTPVRGAGGVATATWTATHKGRTFTGSNTFEVEGEDVVFVEQDVVLEDIPEPAPEA